MARRSSSPPLALAWFAHLHPSSHNHQSLASCRRSPPPPDISSHATKPTPSPIQQSAAPTKGYSIWLGLWEWAQSLSMSEVCYRHNVNPAGSPSTLVRYRSRRPGGANCKMADVQLPPTTLSGLKRSRLGDVWSGAEVEVRTNPE